MTKDSQNSSLSQIPRLPPFVKSGMVTSANTHTVRARINIKPRKLAKVSQVRLNQQFEESKSSSPRPLNEPLGPHAIPSKFHDKLDHSYDSLPRSIKLPVVVPGFRPAYDANQAERSKSFYWPKSNYLLGNSYKDEHKSGDFHQGTMSVDRMNQSSALPAIKFNINDGPVFQTGPRVDWPNKWFSNDQSLSPRRERTLGKIRIWQPTLDSVLRSEAMKHHIIEKAKTSISLKTGKITQERGA